MFIPKMLLHILRSSYTFFQTQMSPGNVARKKLYAHTDLKNLEGTLLLSNRLKLATPSDNHKLFL